MKKTMKSGKIEFYRFVFCICVLYFHIGKYLRGEPSLKGSLRLDFFTHGAIGVEFFFLISGFFMARSIYQKVLSEGEHPERTNQKLSRDYLGFLKHKYLRIMPEHIPMFVMTFLVYVLVHDFGFLKTLVLAADNIPSFFLIQMTGINLGNVLHIEWYLSCMLIAMALLYPFCRRYYYTFTRFFAPLLALLILGYLQKTTSCLTGVTVWMGFAYKSTFRAIAEIALGTTCFELSRFLMENCGTKCMRWVLTVLEGGCFLAVMLFIFLSAGRQFEVLALGLLFVMVAAAGSGLSFGTDWFDKKIFYFLGRMSFPLYLGQLAPIYIMMVKMQGLRFRYYVLYGTLMLIAFTAAAELMAVPIRKWIDRIEKK